LLTGSVNDTAKMNKLLLYVQHLLYKTL